LYKGRGGGHYRADDIFPTSYAGSRKKKGGKKEKADCMGMAEKKTGPKHVFSDAGQERGGEKGLSKHPEDQN